MTPVGPRWDFARRAADNAIVDGSVMSPDEWRLLQETYRVGELVMPCCPGAAIPKRSSNGAPFFAHAGGECASAPESRWHLQAKQCVRDTARLLGYSAELERPGGRGLERWCSDVWVTAPQFSVAIEIQHSYQHMRDYLRRQQRYESAGVKCLWLLMKPHYRTLLNATMKRRYVEEFGRTWPDGQGGCLRELPVAMLELEPSPHARGPRLHVDLATLIRSFVTGGLRWADGAWLVESTAS